MLDDGMEVPVQPALFWTIIAAVAVLLLVFSVNHKYAQLFGSKHITELANGLAQLKRAALSSIIPEGEEYKPERFQHNTIVTSKNLGVIYTISIQQNMYCHHISLSHQTSALAYSAATSFAAWISYILQVSSEKVRVPYSMSSVPGGVWHVVFELTPDEQAAYKSSEPHLLQESSVDSTWKQLGPARAQIQSSSHGET
jgi:hypothetical protein